MKKTFIFVLLSFTFGLNVFAQTDIFARVKPKPDWQVYSHPKDEFSVEFPTTPEVYRYESFDRNDELVCSFGRYNALLNGTYYYVFSGILEKGNIISTLHLSTFISKFTNTYDEIKIGDYDAKVYKFKDSENFYHKIISVATKKQSYILHTFSENEISSEPDRFFDSIVFKNGQTKVKETTVLPEKPDTDLASSAKGVGGISKDNLPSDGRQAGISSLKTVNSGTQSQPITSALKILSQPKPSYTDLARRYNLSGSVLCKTTFLADGTIGEVTPTKKLPFGLTENSIQAAKGVRFEPAKNNGEPVTIVRTIEFNFIY